MRFDAISMQLAAIRAWQKQRRATLSVLRRTMLYLPIMVVQTVGYITLTHKSSGGVMLKTVFDDWIPFWPIWSVPYLLTFVWWIGSLTWVGVHLKYRQFRAFVAATAFMVVTTMLFYTLMPTYVVRPMVIGDGWAENLMRSIFASDGLYCAFPSGHIYLSTLGALYLSYLYPKRKALWISIVVVICAATLFTKQHYLTDVIGGILWAWAGYGFGFWWIGGRKEQGYGARQST
jgi:membrane-associated phospholipid phosphatase